MNITGAFPPRGTAQSNYGQGRVSRGRAHGDGALNKLKRACLEQLTRDSVKSDFRGQRSARCIFPVPCTLRVSTAFR